MKDLHDHLLRRQLADLIARCGDDPRLLREACDLLAESYVNARAAAKWMAMEAARNLGTLPTQALPEQ